MGIWTPPSAIRVKSVIWERESRRDSTFWNFHWKYFLTCAWSISSVLSPYLYNSYTYSLENFLSLFVTSSFSRFLTASSPSSVAIYSCLSSSGISSTLASHWTSLQSSTVSAFTYLPQYMNSSSLRKGSFSTNTNSRAPEACLIWVKKKPGSCSQVQR